MSWAGGSRLFGGVIETLKAHIDDEDKRVDLYYELIQYFRNADWDNLDE